MRKPSKIAFAAFLLIAILTLTAMQNVVSSPGETDECGDCHTTQGVLTLTSNATGTIECDLNSDFSLLVDSDGYTGSDNDYSISLQAGWADNNQFTFTPEEVADGSLNDLNSNTNEIQALFQFTAANAGSFTIRIWTAASGDLATSMDVVVTVTVPAGNPPTIDSPADIEYDLGDTGSSITWTPSDDNPSSYEIFFEESSLRTGPWNSSGETITVDVDGLAIGIYNYTLQVNDEDSMTASDTVFVTVNDPIPEVNTPSDITYLEGSTGHSITWIATDNNPSTYTLWYDGSIIQTGDWNSSGESLVIDVDGIPVEVHNYTIVFTDQSDGNGTDTVMVRVNSATYPTLDHPLDIYVAEGGSIYISWDAYDQNPDNYAIYLDGTIEKSGQWNSPSQQLFISKGGLDLGEYNFTIVVVDDDLNTANDTVWVTIYDGTSPQIDSPVDIEYNEGDATTYTIVWDPTDKYTDSYEIVKDGLQIRSGDWNSSAETISVDVSGQSGGVYNYTLYVTDVGGNTAADSVLVTVVDITDPTIDDVTDFSYVEGSTGNTIAWSPYDDNPTSYEIYLDTILFLDGAWNSSSEDIIVEIDGLEYGEYNFTLIVYDVSSNNASDSVIVTVNDETSPNLNSPSDVEYVEGTTGNQIVWSVSDLHLDSYRIYLNGTEDDTGTISVSPGVITYNIDGLSVGTYNVTILVEDESSNSATDEVTVVVVEATTSSTTTSTSTTDTTGTTDPDDSTDEPEPVHPVVQGYVNTVVATWIGSIIAILIGSEIYRRKFAD